jgi:hypothetical protein
MSPTKRGLIPRRYSGTQLMVGLWPKNEVYLPDGVGHLIFGQRSANLKKHAKRRCGRKLHCPLRIGLRGGYYAGMAIVSTVGYVPVSEKPS